MTFRQSLRRDRRVLESAATLAALASDIGGPLAEAAALLELEIANATARERLAQDRSETLAHALQTFWPDAVSMTTRARQLAQDLAHPQRYQRSRASGYEIALKRLRRLFDEPPSPRTILRLAARN